MLLLLEFDRRVETYASQPITLCWQDGTGKRHYTPDVAVRYTATAVRADPSLRVALIEVKPRTVLWEDWGDLKPKFKAAIAWCRDRSMSFRILTDIEIRTPYLDNARFLLRFRDGKSPAETCWDDPRPQHIREALAEMQSSTPCALVQALTSDEQRQAEYLPWVWRLVDLGYIGCDLHERLTMASPIWTNGVPMIPQTTNRP